MNRRDEKRRALRHYSGVLRDLKRDRFIRRGLTVCGLLAIVYVLITCANAFLPSPP